MNTTNSAIASLFLACMAGCAGTAGTKPPEAELVQSVDRTNVPFSSPECLAAKLPAGESFPASAIPAAALAKRQSGLVAIRYDVIAGVAQNLQIVTSSPAGLYDAAAMQHAARYRAPTAVTVRGCVAVIDVKF
jgi:hypothetical protein